MISSDMTDHNKTPFDQASSSLLSWFHALSSSTFHPSLQIQDLRRRNAGRGIIATSEIPAETDLFTVPRDAIISVESSELAKQLPDLFNENDLKVNDDDDDVEELAPSELPTSWLHLILILLYESLQGPSSKWYPYLSVLPSTPSAFDTLIFWTDEELAALQASAITSKIGRNTADRIFRSQILPVVKEHASIFYGPSTKPSSYLSDEALLAKCHVIGSLIMSYAFDLQPDEDEDEEDDSENNDGWIEDRSKSSMMGMVPMADMLNADAEFNAHLSHGDDALTMTSLRTIKAGEEVLNYYGPLPNAELARRYGYTSAKHARYDVVEIPWSTVRSSIIEELGQSAPANDTSTASSSSPPHATPLTTLLDKLENDENTCDVTDGFILDRDSGDPDDQGLFPSTGPPPKFTKFPDDLVDVISQVAAASLPARPKNAGASADETRLLKRLTLQVLRRIVANRAAAYGSTIEQDELEREGEIETRFRMALDIRIGEKRLLREAAEWTDTMLAKYADIDTGTDARKRGPGGKSGGRGNRNVDGKGQQQQPPPPPPHKRQKKAK